MVAAGGRASQPKDPELARSFYFYQGAELIGLTPIGRATTAVLNMNELKRLELREELLDNAELD